MLQIRLCEESFIIPILNKEIRCPIHLYVGEEAISAGIGAVLNNKDVMFSNHRSHGHYLSKGGELKELIAEIYGKETGCSRGRGGSMHLIYPKTGFLGSAPIVSGTISLAVGSALSFKIRNKKNVAVSFFGDGATGEGVLFESMNFASLKKLPLIFVCENNLYATHLQILETHAKDNIWEMAKPFGIPSFRIDGNNVLEVFEKAQKAVKYCKSGKGPVFIECITYRLMGHVGPDDNIQGNHTDIRPKKEIEAWKKRDPILKFEKYLLKNNVLNKKEIEDVKNKIQKKIEEYHNISIKEEYPLTKNLEKYVFKK
ncbi:MAG: thiamine pyrophosphate-dependent dehydrogenase E1 component subunit alpha [Patescibacteria group bacterium]|nr:thiamine pyrophosphate-dependent dehydrogenase E1 component subunit alpha [Patescibacteria group bacterium]